MAQKIFAQIESEHRSFIERQHIFFVATAARERRVNVAPTGGGYVARGRSEPHYLVEYHGSGE